MFSAPFAKKNFNITNFLNADSTMQLQRKLKQEKQVKYSQLLRNKAVKKRKEFFDKAVTNNKTYTQGLFLAGKDFESPKNAPSGSKSPEKRVITQGKTNA